MGGKWQSANEGDGQGSRVERANNGKTEEEIATKDYMKREIWRNNLYQK